MTDKIAENRVDNLKTLNALVCAKRSVVCPAWAAWKKPKPAAVVMNLQGGVLLRMFRSGLYLYEPKGKKHD